MIKYFYRVPNSCTDYREIMIRFCLDRHRTLEDITYVSLYQICRDCNYTLDRHKGNFLDYTKGLLLQFIEQGLIVQCLGKPPDKADVYEMLGFVLDKQFSPADDYIALSADSFDKIVKIKTSIKREILINTYLYIKSFIFDYQSKEKNANKEYGFYGSLEVASNELGYSRKTVDTCMDLFVENGIFVKSETGSYKKLNGKITNAPNVYVLNDENAQRNIETLKKKIQEQYNIVELLPITYRNRPLRK